MTMPDSQYHDEQIDPVFYAVKEMETNLDIVRDAMARGDRAALMVVRKKLEFHRQAVECVLDYIELTHLSRAVA